MNNDPLEFYASKMREVKASERLLDSVRQEADAARSAVQQAEESQTTCDASQQASDPRPVRNTTAKIPHAPQRTRIVHPRKTKQPARFKFAMAACLAALALVVGISLTLPNLNIFGPGGGSTFTIKAYGAVDDTLFPTGSNDIIAFNCETETQRFVSPDPETYENEGFYTGCVFSVEGENITRIQANTSRGELYRVTSEVLSMESDPQLSKEANEWKQTKIGQGELLGAYDYVASVSFFESISADDENVGKMRGDPSTLRKLNLYQRLGATVDTAANMAQSEENPKSYTFGIWTNEPLDPIDVSGPESDPDANLNAALDTLDGAQLTVTVTFKDGTCATQVIDLKAADFKANVITAADGMSKLLELVPQMVDVSDKTVKEKRADFDQGIASIHTLYGTISQENDQPFPCGEASYPNLTEPLTKPVEIKPPEESHEVARSESIAKPTVNPKYLTELENTPVYVEEETWGQSQLIWIGTETKFERAERLTQLPEGVTLSDLSSYYPESWYDPSLDHIDLSEPGRTPCTIFADGTLTPGYSFVLITKLVTNTSDQSGEAFIVDGAPATVEQETDAGGWHPFTMQGRSDPIWRSNHEAPGWDKHVWFQAFEPGETKEISVLYLVPDETLASPDFAFFYSEWDKAFRIGALL